jgi:hypothetical protein
MRSIFNDNYFGLGEPPTPQGYKVSVANPSNPNQLIQVDAVRDANGNLVPIDSRYNVKLGFNNQQPKPSIFPNEMLLLGGAALLLVLLLGSRK